VLLITKTHLAFFVKSVSANCNIRDQHFQFIAISHVFKTAIDDHFTPLELVIFTKEAVRE